MKLLKLLCVVTALGSVLTPLFSQTYLGNYTGHDVSNHGVTVRSDTTAVRFVFYRDDIARVDFLPGPSTVADSSFAVIRDTTQSVAFTVVDSDSQLSISSVSLQIICRKNPMRISYSDGSGKLLLAEPLSGGLATNGVQRWATFSIRADDHYYGTGERGTAMDKTRTGVRQLQHTNVRLRRPSWYDEHQHTVRSIRERIRTVFRQYVQGAVRFRSNRPATICLQSVRRRAFVLPHGRDYNSGTTGSIHVADRTPAFTSQMGIRLYSVKIRIQKRN